MSHTPGPWMRYQHNAMLYPDQWWISAGDCNGYAPNGDYMSVMGSCGEHNARLIAAAPELLDALKAAVEDCSMSMAPDIMDMASAAIAKAEGE